MNNKGKNMLIALSAFQLASTALSGTADAMTIKDGKVSVGDSVSCEITGLLMKNVMDDIVAQHKYSKNAQIIHSDTVATILKKLNHQYEDAKTAKLDSKGYYDEYPEKLPDYFATGSCKVRK